MSAVLWVIADELDYRRVPPNVADAVWLEIPSKDLRGEGARSDNHHLRKVLDDLQGLTLKGEYRGDPWGAVVIAEYHITQGGAVTRLLIPPAAIKACRSPSTFAKIESYAAFQFKGHAKALYAALADKKRLGNPFWVYQLDELREVLGVTDKKSYLRFNNLRQWALEPALEEINDFGTVTVEMTPMRVGRAVAAVRFDWKWKTLDQAQVTDEENDQPKGARHMDRKQDDAPPLTDREKDAALYSEWTKKTGGGSYGEFAEWRKVQAG